MRQLQFKFDPLPAESAEICLFHERWMKSVDTQPFGQLCIKYVLVFYKIDLFNLATIIWEVLHKKTSFWALEKWKMIFSSKEMKTSLSNIVCHSKMPLCARYEIIWLESHESSHMIAHF